MGVENDLLLDGEAVGKGEVYKRSAAMNRFLRISAIALVVVVTGLLVYLHWEPRLEGPAVVSVQVQEGSVRVSNGAGEVKLAAGDGSVVEPGRAPTLIAAQPTPEAPVSPTPTPVLPEMPSEPVLAVRLIDALGDPIPNGVIEIASKTYQSASSEFIIRDVSEGTHTFVARADGHFSATETVQIPADEWKTVTLEYKCEFEVQVSDKNGGPVEGAEVFLYEAIRVPRPVADSLGISVARGTYRQDGPGVVWKTRGITAAGGLTLRRRENRVLVAAITGAPAFFHVDYENYVDALTDAQKGDEVTGLTASSETPGDTPKSSSQLRLWDTLAPLCLGGVESGSVGRLLSQRKTESLYAHAFCRDLPPRGRLIGAAITDESGKCRFGGLPPCIYLTEARKSLSRSSPALLTPMNRTTTITLLHEKDNNVCVTVRRANCDFYALRWIADADVQVRGVNGLVIFSATTSPAGRADFTSVPWGEYQLTVTAPADLDAKPPSKQMALLVEYPETRVRVEFDVEFGVTVSGTVVRGDTRRPLPNYPLQLVYNRRPAQPGRPGPLGEDHWIFYSSTISDHEGRFQFARVMPGPYMINGYSVREHQTGFIHLGKGIRPEFKPGEPPDPRRTTEPRFQVSNEDIDGIEYTVCPALETRLLGVVVDTDGEPVPRADLELERLSKDALPSEMRTDEEGGFAISLFLPESDEPSETRLRASVKDRPVQRIWFDPDGQARKSVEETGILTEGSVRIIFNAGDTVRDLRIILDPINRGQAVVGTIRRSDGRIPEHVQGFEVSASQEHPDHPEDWRGGHRISPVAWIEPDGSFRVEKLKPGPFTLSISAPFRAQRPEEITLPPPGSYHSQTKELIMPEGVESIQYDFVVEEDSHIHGRVIDQDFKPITQRVRAPLVMAEAADGGEGGASDWANSEGYFLLRVLPGKEYTLRVRDHREGGGVFAAKFENLRPPIENLIFQVNTEQIER